MIWHISFLTSFRYFHTLSCGLAVVIVWIILVDGQSLSLMTIFYVQSSFYMPTSQSKVGTTENFSKIFQFKLSEILSPILSKSLVVFPKLKLNFLTSRHFWHKYSDANFCWSNFYSDFLQHSSKKICRLGEIRVKFKLIS